MSSAIFTNIYIFMAILQEFSTPCMVEFEI